MLDGRAARPFAELSGVSKYFSGARALEGVDFSCHEGSIHAILGENGAGKWSRSPRRSARIRNC